MADNNQQTSKAPEQGAAAAAAPPQPPLRPCPKDCSKCTMQQHAFCAAKMSFDSFTVMNTIIQRLDAMTDVIAELSARIATMQNSETLASPSPVQGELFQDAK